jgi:hypothetical protein
MRALKPDELPEHPDLKPPQKSSVDVTKFISDILQEAEVFMTSYLPKHFTTKAAKKQSLPSKAPVLLLSHELDARSLGSTRETWFARTSIHANTAEKGTATWEEFDFGLRQDHSQHEKDYTPDVIDAHEVVNWPQHLPEDIQAGDTGFWKEITLGIMEMVHHIPPPLNDRVFPELVLTAKHADGKKFLVVQIPVDTTGLASAKYNTSSNAGKKVQEGMYCSIERGELIDGDGDERGNGNVKWQMVSYPTSYISPDSFSVLYKCEETPVLQFKA